MHRGGVEAQSTLGKGSEFIVKLPMMISPDVPIVQCTETVARSGRSLKVLVVDDNVDAAKGVAMLLRAYGHEDPATLALKHGVRVGPGEHYQPGLDGHVRLNIATEARRLEQIVERLAAAVT